MSRLIRDVMTAPIKVLEAGSDLSWAVTFFDRNLISGAPVVEADGTLVGVLSRTDIAGHLARGGSLSERVDQVMTPFAFVLGPDDPMTKALTVMLETRIHRVVVSDAKGHPVGIVTTMDLLGQFLELLNSTKV